MDEKLQEVIAEILWRRLDLYEWYVDNMLEDTDAGMSSPEAGG